LRDIFGKFLPELIIFEFPSKIQHFNSKSIKMEKFFHFYGGNKSAKKRKLLPSYKKALIDLKQFM